MYIIDHADNFAKVVADNEDTFDVHYLIIDSQKGVLEYSKEIQRIPVDETYSYYIDEVEGLTACGYTKTPEGILCDDDDYEPSEEEESDDESLEDEDEEESIETN